MTPERAFAFRLALVLGYANPDVMLAEIPYRVYREWREFYRRDPWCQERADLRAGIIASTVANCLSRKKGKPAFKVEQFMPDFAPKKRLTQDQLFQKILFLQQMFDGVIVDKRK